MVFTEARLEILNLLLPDRHLVAEGLGVSLQLEGTTLSLEENEIVRVGK